MRSEIRFAGFGGQGIISAGKITGRAASIYDGQDAVLMQSYGPEARGGACSADVVVSTSQISYPQLSVPNYLVIMSQAAYEKYGHTIEPEGILISDEDLVEVNEDSPIDNRYVIPATRTADELGNKIVSNVVMLGALTAITDIVSKNAMLEAILASVSTKFKELNERAFNLGFEKGQRVIGAKA